jgi:uncharacterized protein YdeI (YjbR/CyaY-like superfamily)
MKKANSVEEYIEKHEKWTDALLVLQNIMLSTELEETIKWSAPVYTINGKNVLSIGAFNNHFGIWFFNGVFLKDKHKLLRNAQDGKTKAMRQLKFTAFEQIDKVIITTYVNEAIVNQKLGKELKPNRNKKEAIIPPELQDTLNNNITLKKHFETLSPSKQREYCEYIASAKQEATKVSRLEKIKPMILKGVGLHDKYKNC